MMDGDSWPAFEVDVISTHGAGDMFVGALAAEVDAGRTIQEAIPFAQAAAALHVSMQLNERAHLDHAQVAAFLSAHSSR